MAHASPIRLYLFGSFRLERDSQTIRLPTRKVESLFAFLALFPEQHPREKLAALLWGDSTDEQARHSLRTALATLRKELGDEILLTDRETVQLNPDPPLWVDALEFQAQANKFLAQSSSDPTAINFELYQNDLLKEFYDDWIIPERERLHLLYLDALLRLAQHYRSASDYARAIEIAQKVLATDRANEKAYQHLMFCYAATGDRIGALRQYDECARFLRDELSVEPSSETSELRDQIMRELTGAPSREAGLTNLPIPLTSFVGREKERKELAERLASARLLTLTGAGGCGKTRLAIQVGREFAEANRYKNGVWWAELAPLADPTLVAQTVASVFDLRETSDTPLIYLLTNYLREKELLLVLDSCEHLIDACARLAEMLLAACSKLQILATSRETLSITGEVVWRVPSLAVPDADHLPPLDQLVHYEAIQLFVQRVTAVVPNWKLDSRAAAVAHICARLDGIPLAIELAAARLKVMSAEQIAARLDDRFRLLTGGSRTALPRQQTLRAAIDWSYELLSEKERVLFRRLAVFAGGWTLRAAEEIVGVEGMDSREVVDLLLRLVDKSLVIVSEQSGETPYHMLETIRQYAHEKLVESGEWQPMRARHLDFFLKLAEEAEAKLRGAEQVLWLNRLEWEHDNLRAALQWSIENQGADPNRKDWALRLAGALSIFWYEHSHWSEGRRLLREALKRSKDASTSMRAKALVGAGYLALFQNDYEEAQTFLEQSLALYREQDDKRGIANTLFWLGMVAGDQGDYPRAVELVQESLDLRREIEDESGVAYSLHLLGELARDHGDYSRERQLLEESLTLSRKLGDKWGIGLNVMGLGELALRQRAYELATALGEESLALWRELGDKRMSGIALETLGFAAHGKGDNVAARALLAEALRLLSELRDRWSIPRILEGSAAIASTEGSPERAARLFGAAEALREAANVPLPPADRADYDHNVAAVRAQLDEAAFAKAWAEGRAMTLEQAVEYALENVKSI